MFNGCLIAPAVQAINVDSETFNPQLTAIIDHNVELVVARPEDSQAACPTYSDMITPFEMQVLATTTLAEIADEHHDQERAHGERSHVWARMGAAPHPQTTPDHTFYGQSG